MKKIISLILSVSLILGTVITASLLNASAYTKDTNIFSNGDFEDSTKAKVKGDVTSYGDTSVSKEGIYDCDNWYRYGYGGDSTQYYKSEKKNGNASLRLFLGTGVSYDGGKFFKNFNVEKNTSYTISFWYYVPSASSVTGAVKTTAAIPPSDSSSNILAFGDATNTDCTLTSGSMTEWKQYTNIFGSGENEVLRLAFGLTGKSSTELNTYIDDIIIEETPIFTNGDFEDSSKTTVKGGTSGDSSVTNNVYDCDTWFRSGYGFDVTTQYCTDEKHTGEASMRMSVGSSYSTGAAIFFKNFKVEKNTDYNISFWYYAKSANSVYGAVTTTSVISPENASGDAKLLGFGASYGGVNGNFTLTWGSETGWKEYSWNFNSGENTTIRLIFKILTNSNERIFYLDDVVVKKLVTATFDNNNGTEGDEETLTGVPGTTMNPTEPIMEGYEFGGWYTDTEYTTEAPTTYPETNTTYYAKWVLTSPVTTGDYAGVFAGSNAGKGNTDIEYKENSAIYEMNGIEYTAFRVYGTYDCPVVDGVADPSKIMVDGVAKELVSRTLYLGDPANDNDVSKYPEYTSSTTNLKNVWDCVDNDDGTATVTYSFLLRDIIEDWKDYAYAVNTSVTYKEGDEEITVNGVQLGGDTMTPQKMYESANVDNSLAWFTEAPTE